MSASTDGLSDAQRTALHRLVEDGVLTAAQDEAVRAALAAAAPRREGPARWVMEIGGYIGGGLMIAGVSAFMAASWHDLSRTGRGGLLALYALAFVLAGVLVAGGPTRVRGLVDGHHPARRRITGVLFGLASVPAALAVAVLASNRYDGVSGSLAGLVVAAAGLALLPTAPGLVATAGMSLATAEYAASEVLRTSALGTGLVTIALGLAWIALALTPVLPSRPLGLVAGTGFALLGAQLPLGDGSSAPWAYGMTFALAVGAFVGYRWQRSIVLLVAGVLGVTLAVPEAVLDWTNGALGASVILLVAGAVLVAASAIGLRLRREATPAPPVRYP